MRTCAAGRKPSGKLGGRLHLFIWQGWTTTPSRPQGTAFLRPWVARLGRKSGCEMGRSNVKANAPAWAGPIGMPNPRAISEENKPIRLIFVDDDDDYREAATGEIVDLGFVLESFLLPVVFLTGRSSYSHESLAFDRGALDFVDKSRGVPILAKRLHAIVKSSRRPPELEVDETQHCGRLMLKPRVSRAFWDAIDINLTVSEFNIVRLLASNVGNHVTYRAVYDCMHSVGFIVGSGEEGLSTNVRSTINRIRNKFRLVDPEFAETENYPSFGYRWRRPKDPAR